MSVCVIWSSPPSFAFVSYSLYLLILPYKLNTLPTQQKQTLFYCLMPDCSTHSIHSQNAQNLPFKIPTSTLYVFPFFVFVFLVFSIHIFSMLWMVRFFHSYPFDFAQFAASKSNSILPLLPCPSAKSHIFWTYLGDQVCIAFFLFFVLFFLAHDSHIRCICFLFCTFFFLLNVNWLQFDALRCGGEQSLMLFVLPKVVRFIIISCSLCVCNKFGFFFSSYIYFL